MGALHQGHLSLIKQARQENDFVVCSIFVNPIQFNRAEDLHNYPRTPEKDLIMLEAEGCDLVFMPNEMEMYPEPLTESFDFGVLDTVMEGAFRPGHFKGVATVVKRLFEIVKPHAAYFGEKDYQQLLVIKSLCKQLNLTLQIVSCPIIREADGLAMSSRNMRLSTEQRTAAPVIYKALLEARKMSKFHSAEQIHNYVVTLINSNPHLKVEYFEIADANTLLPPSGKSLDNCIACIAVNAGNIRLIDNIIL